MPSTKLTEMRDQRLQMGMKTVVEIAGPCRKDDLEEVFNYFDHVDRVFSPFKADSEVSRFGRGEIDRSKVSPELDEVLNLAEKTKKESGGYFDVWHKGRFDPSGIVKGWAIHQAAEMLRGRGFQNFYVEAGGDIEVAGKNSRGRDWRIGIRHPFDKDKLSLVIKLGNAGIATSGTYLLGQHIYRPELAGRRKATGYNPHRPGPIQGVVSLSVVGPNIYEADRMATAAFAMGEAGLQFLEGRAGLEALAVRSNGTIEMTGGFKQYLSS